jgi:hypothetical protein
MSAASGKYDVAKWKDFAHVRAALRQHILDLQSALALGDEALLKKELADFAVIAKLFGVPQSLEFERFEKFLANAHKPSLAQNKFCFCGRDTIGEKCPKHGYLEAWPIQDCN